MERIDKKIMGWRVTGQPSDTAEFEALLEGTEKTDLRQPERNEAVDIKIPKRPRRLDNTWRLKPPYSEHALYVHLSSITVGGKKHPFEIFFSSKDVNSRMWTDSLTLAWSAIFRSAIENGTSLAELISNLKDTNCSEGGYRVKLKEDDEKPTFVNSVVAEIGHVIEEFYHECLGWNLETYEALAELDTEAYQASRTVTLKEGIDLKKGAFVTSSMLDHFPTINENIISEGMKQANKAFCPSCKQPTLMKQAGCDLCSNCGYSKC